MVNTGTTPKKKHRFAVTIRSIADEKIIMDALKEQRIEVVPSESVPALMWITQRDTCPASVTLWCLLQGVPQAMAYVSAPLDEEEFASCYRLLRAVPGWRERIGEMATIDRWRVLVEEWDDLERLYEQIARDEDNVATRRRLRRRLRECAWSGSRLNEL